MESKITIDGPGLGLVSLDNAIWWNMALFFYVQAKNWLDGSLAKSLIRVMYKLIHVGLYMYQ